MSKYILIFLAFFLLQSCKKKTHVNGALESLRMLAHQKQYPKASLASAMYYQEISDFKAGDIVKKRNEMPDPWESIGPHNIAGRALSLAINPQNNKTIYVGSASGGLWRSYNQGKGVSWEQVPLGYPVLGISSIAFAPKDSTTIFLGTGEVYNHRESGNGAAYRSTRGTYGIGILKSTDGGESWSKALDWSYDLNRGVHVVKVAPSNSNLIYAGTTEGVYKSSDGGDNWDLILDVLLANDLLINPSDGNTIIVGCGNLGSPGRGIYQSEDGGISWAKFNTSSFQGKTQLAQDPTDEMLVYAGIGNGFGFSDGATSVYASDNGGRDWTLRNTTDYSKWQGWFAHDLAVNPFDPSKMLFIGIEIYASDTRGTFMSKVTNGGLAMGTPPIGEADGPPNFTHSDHHDVVYDPQQEGLVYVANDGGVYASEDGGNSWESRNGGLQTTQFYNGFSVYDDENTILAMGGLQDNSTIEYTGSKAWNRVIGGDGAWASIDQSDPETRYGSLQNLNVYRRDESGFYAKLPVIGSQYPTAFIAPFVVAPSDPNIIYAGRNRVLKSINQGEDWIQQEQLSSTDFIFSMDVSANNPNYLYVATAPNFSRPTIYRTKDGGQSYTEIKQDLPNAYINDIHIHPSNPETVYITLGGFGDSHVFVSKNAGDSWLDITGNLPAIPTSAILVDPVNENTLYVGNDFGVFYSEDDGDTWHGFNEGIVDATLVMDLKMNSKTRKLYVATHGNGAFERDLIGAGTSSIAEESMLEGAKLLENPVSNQLTVLGLNQELRYNISSIDGRILKSGKIAQDGNLTLNALSNGQYFLSLINKEEMKTLNFIKVE